MEERLPKSMKHEKKKERKKSPGPIFRNTNGFLLKKIDKSDKKEPN